MFAEISIVEPARESGTLVQGVRADCSKPIIRIENLCVEYRGSTRKLALDDLNLAVAAGKYSVSSGRTGPARPPP